MYNRYIPQSDGSFQKKYIPDPPKPEFVPCSPKEQTPQSCPPPPPAQHPPVSPSRPHPRPCRESDPSIGSFLKQLLPKNFDAGDLLVVVLLLLLSGDCKEDQNTALLTLALYLFM